MALSVAVHKDASEYEPKIIGKLTKRTLLSILGAVTCSLLVGLFIYFVLGLSVSDYSFVIYATSLPFWLIGFYKPKGLYFEVWLPYYLRHKLSNNKIFYVPSCVLSGYVTNEKQKKKKKINKEYNEFMEENGVEAYSPRTGMVNNN